jgi:hypothetical protein
VKSKGVLKEKYIQAELWANKSTPKHHFNETEKDDPEDDEWNG